MGAATFYAHAYSTPEGFAEAAVEPEAARRNADLGEFLLPPEAAKTAPDPEGALMRFSQTTQEAATNAAGWDRDALDRAPGCPRVPRPVSARASAPGRPAPCEGVEALERGVDLAAHVGRPAGDLGRDRRLG